MTTVPHEPGMGAPAVEFHVAPWQLGFKVTDSIKGKSSMVAVMECCLNFLERPFSSSEEPLQILMPRGASVDAPIPDFSIRHSVGFAKSLALQTVLVAVHEVGGGGSERCRPKALDAQITSPLQH